MSVSSHPFESSRPFSLQPSRRFKRRPARLLHVGPLGLEIPREGLPGLPARLAQQYADASDQAVVRVFRAAIEHNVDAVLLAGGLPDPTTTGFRPLARVYEQCRHLAEHQIPVVVAGPDPSLSHSRFEYLRAPRNVFFVAENSRSVVTVGDPSRRRRLDIGSAAIDSDARFRVIMSSNSAFAMNTNSVFATPTVQTPANANAAAFIPGPDRADYVALGSSATPGTHPATQRSRPVWQAGLPQSAGREAVGPHGAVLVSLDRSESPQVERIACDVVRNHSFDLHATDGSQWDDLHKRLWSHLERVRSDNSVAMHVVRWNVLGHGQAWCQLEAAAANHSWLEAARGAFAERPDGPAVWPAQLNVIPDESQHARDLAEDTSFGRAVRMLSNQPTRPSHQMTERGTKEHGTRVRDAAIARLRSLLAP